MRLIKSLLVTILNTLFPPVCIACKKEGDFLCAECLNHLEKKKIHSGFKKLPVDQPEFKYLDGVIYALDYAKNPTIQAAIKQLKYRFTEELANYFADLMVEKIGELAMTRNRRIVLIPVPLHKKRLNYRGFNQAEVIASAVQVKSPNVERVNLLERTRHTSQQAKLNKFQRHRNLRGAFKVKQSMSQLDKKSIYFIVDDVCTTGATLEQCAKVLKAAGLPKVYGLVIARAFK